jgi:hypothetical protein
MQAVDGKNVVDVPEGFSVPHDTRQEPAVLGRTGPLAKVYLGRAPTASSNSRHLSSSTGSRIWSPHRVSIGTGIAD